jgi:hypothetical protein
MDRGRVLLGESELIPVATLELNPSVDNAEETATTETGRIAPLEDRPLTIFEQILDETHHLRASKLGREHGSDRLAPHHGIPNHLVIGRINRIEGRERLRIGTVERIDPCLHNFSGSHRVLYHAT